GPAAGRLTRRHRDFPPVLLAAAQGSPRRGGGVEAIRARPAHGRALRAGLIRYPFQRTSTAPARGRRQIAQGFVWNIAPSADQEAKQPCNRRATRTLEPYRGNFFPRGP